MYFSMNNRIEEEIKEKYINARERLILLDYDGTLVNYVAVPATASLPPYIFDILNSLIDVPKTKTFIITGRAHNDIDKLLHNMPINIIAEHGAMIREGVKWKHQFIDNASWKEPIIRILGRFTEKCPGSHIEEKIYSVSWHYRKSDADLGLKYSRELLQLLKSVARSHNIRILDGKKVVEILTNDSGKGSAVKKLIEQKKYDFVLAIGDDTTDEEMFEFLLHYTNAITIKVGEGSTFAKLKFSSINEVITLLKLLLS
jgi:trehalose 6-phosphate synthase/phosphatase